MATAIYFGFPGHGHVIPSLPIVAELARRGERVVYYVTPPFQASVERAGATFRPYGAEFPLADRQTLARFASGMREAISVELETSRWVLDNLLPEIRAAAPAYILHESLCAWGGFVSQILDTPSVSLYPTFAYPYEAGAPPSLPRRARNLARRLLQARAWAQAGALSRRYRLPPLADLNRLVKTPGTLNLVYTSREFQPGGAALDPARYKFIGPSVVPRAEAPAFPFEQLDGRALLFVSLGTAFHQQPAFYQACLYAFSGAPWQVVMAVGANSPLTAPGSAPPNFIVRDSVPQLELLKRTRVFLSHGGMNSVNEALYYDVPLVMVPQGGDQAWIAGRVCELGAGIRIGKTEVTAGRLRDAVQAILDGPAYAAAAARIGSTLRATGGPVQAADEILALKRASGITG